MLGWPVNFKVEMIYRDMKQEYFIGMCLVKACQTEDTLQVKSEIKLDICGSNM